MLRFIKKLSLSQIIVIGYILVIMTGSILLSLPMSSMQGTSTKFIDSLFTATSATAVTGQVTLNTASHWNYFGRTVIISLIEIGGLGFMTIWLLFYYALTGHQPNLKQRKVFSETLSLSGKESVQGKIWYIVKFALTAQFIGAVLLSFEFIPTFGLLKGIYFSFFHSISAFCNAGFDLLGNSLINYQDNPYILLVIAGLIMTGGLGFIVWEDILNYRKKRKLKKYTKLVLITTISIWVIGTLYFWVMEKDNPEFSSLPFSKQLANYFFLSVTPRTAGYANVDYTNLNAGSIFLTFILMFIGASSASTGGGIKVSTLAVLLISMHCLINKRQPTIYGRHIPNSTIKNSFFIFTSGIMIATVSTLILLFTETLPPNAGIEFILMEVFSTLGTVGLTMGMTPLLTSIGKFILILLMLIGRVGMLTFLLSLVGEKKESRVKYPDINILIG